MKILSNGRSLEGIEVGITALEDRMTAMEFTLKKIQKGMEQILAVQSDINGNRATQAGCAIANNATVGQHDITTQLGWEPDNASQVANDQENAGDGNESMEQGFKSEVVQTTTPESGVVETSVQDN